MCKRNGKGLKMPQVLEWRGAGPDEIVWRFPDTELKWGAQLIVQENQVAIFYRDGKALDTFGPGKYTLTTKNLPILTGILRRIKGYDKNPFTAEVIFISKSQFQGKFGGRGQTSDLAPLMFHGNFWYRVEEEKVFTNEVVGNQRAYTSDAVNDFLRSFINEKVIDEFAHYDLQAVFTQLDETSLKVKVAVRRAFERIGLELIDLKFEGIDTTEKYRERLFWLRTGGVQGDRLRTMEATESAAESLGHSPGAGFGAAAIIGQTLASGGAKVICPSCGAHVDAGAKFCPKCGARLSGASGGGGGGTPQFCPNCGTKLPPGTKFCPSCGTKVA